MLQQCPGQKNIGPNMFDCFIFMENENCVAEIITYTNFD